MTLSRVCKQAESSPIRTFDHRYPHPPLRKDPSAGARNIDWQIGSEYFAKSVPIALLLEAYLFLIKAHLLVCLFGFCGLIKAIRRNARNCIAREAEEFGILATALNQACLYFPVRTKCLEWSAALAFLGLRRKWKCNLQIGIQNMPFAAHAWVSVDGRVIADTQTLPDTLSVILSEPFDTVKANASWGGHI